MIASPWFAALIAVFVWWFSTGAILMIVRQADHQQNGAHRRAALLGIPVFVLGWIGFWWSLDQATIAGAYAAFLSVIAIWGWIELAFLTGVITGPNHSECPEDVPQWERFIRAWGTIAYSEAMLLGSLLVMVWLSYGAANMFGTWTFIVLFFARISAKLNLYFGVPNINAEFLPVPMRHLASHFRVARMNAFFPVGITLLSFAAACWMERAWAAEGADLIGFALLVALTSLAILEHWVMVLPIPDAKLWRWMMPAPAELNTKTSYRHEDAHGL